MRLLHSFLLLICSIPILHAQTVNSIHTEQVGDKIMIHYQVDGVNSEQLMAVTVSCLVNNSVRIELQSVSGDVGPNVAGGKEEYTVIWDVLKDVEELNNAEFFVKVELQSNKRDESFSEEVIDAKYRYSFTYVAGLKFTPFGGRFDYIEKYGYYAAYRFGIDGGTTGGNTTTLMSVTLGMSQGLYSSGDFSLRAYFGAGYGYWGEYEDESGVIEMANNDSGVELDVGITLNVDRLQLHAGPAFNFGGNGNHMDIHLGLGFNF